MKCDGRCDEVTMMLHMTTILEPIIFCQICVIYVLFSDDGYDTVYDAVYDTVHHDMDAVCNNLVNLIYFIFIPQMYFYAFLIKCHLAIHLLYTFVSASITYKYIQIYI